MAAPASFRFECMGGLGSSDAAGMPGFLFFNEIKGVGGVDRQKIRGPTPHPPGNNPHLYLAYSPIEKSHTESQPAMLLDNVILSHIAALNDALADAIEDESDQALDIALLLLDLYETIMEQSGLMIVYRGEELH